MYRLRMTSLQKDYLASCLRTEIHTFQDLLETVETTDPCEVQYILESLKVTELKLRALGKSLANLN